MTVKPLERMQLLYGPQANCPSFQLTAKAVIICSSCTCLDECVLSGQGVCHTSVRAEVWPDVCGTSLFRNRQTDDSNNTRLCSIGWSNVAWTETLLMIGRSFIQRQPGGGQVFSPLKKIGWHHILLGPLFCKRQQTHADSGPNVSSFFGVRCVLPGETIFTSYMVYRSKGFALSRRRRQPFLKMYPALVHFLPSRRDDDSASRETLRSVCVTGWSIYGQKKMLSSFDTHQTNLVLTLAT